MINLDDSRFEPYPIEWRHTKIYQYDDPDIPRYESEMTITGDKLHKYNSAMITYSIFPSKDKATKPLIDFARKITVFNEMWQDAIVKNFGQNNDVQVKRLEAYFLDPDDPCKQVTLIYPGQQLHYNAAG